MKGCVSVELKTHREMQHERCEQEIQDVAAFLTKLGYEPVKAERVEWKLPKSALNSLMRLGTTRRRAACGRARAGKRDRHR